MMETAITGQALRDAGWRERTSQGFSALVGPIWSRRAARPGQFLEARARVLRATKNLVFMQGEVSAGGTLISSGQAVMKRVSR